MRYVAKPIDLPILFEDGEALVIAKPAGLAVTAPRRGGLSLEDHLHSLRLGFQRDPMAAHRLDRDTSGCLLLARNPKALKRFMAAFENRQVGKTYVAMLAGHVGDDSGVIDLPLIKTSTEATGWRMAVDGKGKAAVTRWRKLDDLAHGSLIAFTPETGRTHQLRIHAKAGLGHALLGDPVYGEGGMEGARRTMLHALAITVERAGKPSIAATAPFPDDLRALGAREDHAAAALA